MLRQVDNGVSGGLEVRCEEEEYAEREKQRERVRGRERRSGLGWVG